ncbi:MAG TPA: DUF4097 family beta strand repeat-containing protein [Streptosporangiaceae bacterium]
MKAADPLAGLPSLPAEQDLPHHEQVRAAVLAGITPGRPRRALRPARRLLYPLGAAAAVAAIVTTLAVVLPSLAGHSAGSPPAPQPAGSGSMISPGTHISTFTGVRVLVIKDGAGTVSVTGSARHSVLVRARVTARIPRGAASSEISDGVLQLAFAAPDCPAAQRPCPSVNYAIQVPRALPVQVLGSTGDVSLSGLSGIVRVDDRAGDVSLAGLSGPAVTARTDAGSVTMSGVSSAQLTVTADAGDVHGTGLGSPATVVYAGAGDLSLGYASAPDSVRITDPAGDITLGLPPGGTAYRVSAQTGAGSASVSVPQSATSHRIITARSGAGDITISN